MRKVEHIKLRTDLKFSRLYHGRVLAQTLLGLGWLLCGNTPMAATPIIESVPPPLRLQAHAFIGAATPIIEWVSPPAWLQTGEATLPAKPGMAIVGPAWLVTGRGGRAAVRVQTEEIRIADDAVWHWSGPQDAGSGNVVQGSVRVGVPQDPDRVPLHTNTSHSPIRLHRDGRWLLLLGPGTQLSNATRMVNFMRNSGYPVRLDARKMSDDEAEWWVALDGFREAEWAMNAGRQLSANVLGLSLVVVVEEKDEEEKETETEKEKLRGAAMDVPAH